MDRPILQSNFDPALVRFAERLEERIGAQAVFLFGSRARGEAHQTSDYDLIVVSPYFAALEPPRRAIGLRDLWYEVGGDGPMDLVCLTPKEFALAQDRITLVAAVLPEAIELVQRPGRLHRLASLKGAKGS